MVTIPELVSAVEDAYAARGLPSWADPHLGRQPSEDEYSRVTDPDKWRIVGARVDAWFRVLEDAGLATVERDTTVAWVSEPGTRIATTDRAVPRRPGALALVAARSAIGGAPDVGVTFGVGDPAVCVGWQPDCGCDACDSGSQNELDVVDQTVLGVVAGTFRRLTSGDRQITQLDRSGWSATGDFGRREVEALLADPKGWHEIAGAPWLP